MEGGCHWWMSKDTNFQLKKKSHHISKNILLSFFSDETLTTSEYRSASFEIIEQKLHLPCATTTSAASYLIMVSDKLLEEPQKK